MFLGPWFSDYKPEDSSITEVANGPSVEMLSITVVYIHYHFFRPFSKLPTYFQVLLFGCKFKRISVPHMRIVF
jgi:hypothetical protein